MRALCLRLLPLAAFFGAEEGVDDFHVLDGVFDAPDGFLFLADDAAEGFGLQLVLVGDGQFVPVALVHLHALDEIAVGLVGRGVEGNFNFDAALGAADLGALPGGELG